MIVQFGDTQVIAMIYAENDDKTPRPLAWDDAGLAAWYKHGDDPAWTQIPLMAGTIGQWTSTVGPDAYGLIYAGKGVTEVSVPDEAILSFGTVPNTLILITVDDVAVAPPIRLDYRGIPVERAGANGGLPTLGQLPQSQGLGIVQKVSSFSTGALNQIWGYATQSIAMLSPVSIGYFILRTLGVIGSSYKAFSADKTAGRVTVTRGDDMTETTGVRYRFSFTGWPDITDKVIKGEIVEVGGEVAQDDLPGAIETASANPSALQSALISIPEEVSSVLDPTDTLTSYELLCRVEYSAGKWVEVGRCPLDVLRG